MTCPRFDSGTGINVSNENVTLVNPHVVDCARGIVVSSGGFKIFADANAAGYRSPMLDHMNSGLVFQRGAHDFKVRGLGGGRLFIRNTFRPVTLQAGHSGLIQNVHSRHPATIAWTAIRKRSIVGIKCIADFTALQGSDRSLHDIVIRNNDVADFTDEGISFDGNGNEGADSLVRGTGNLVAVNAADRTVRLGAAWSNLGQASGAWLSFNTGGARGRYLHIVGVDAATKTLRLADPDNVLSAAEAGNEVSVGGVYRNIELIGNTIDVSGDSNVGIATGGPVYKMQVRDNTVRGSQNYHYGDGYHMRQCGNTTCLQSVKINTLSDMPAIGGGMTIGQKTGLSAFVSVTGNKVDHDISLTTRGTNNYARIPHYAAGNTHASGQLHRDSSYQGGQLDADPNP